MVPIQITTHDDVEVVLFGMGFNVSADHAIRVGLRRRFFSSIKHSDSLVNDIAAPERRIFFDLASHFRRFGQENGRRRGILREKKKSHQDKRTHAEAPFEKHARTRGMRERSTSAKG